MISPLRTLAAATAALGLASVGALAVAPDEKPQPARPAEEKPLDLGKVQPGKPADLKHAVDPKPLSDSVKKGLKWLADTQNPDGGWSQGGGWRTGGQGRVEGKEVADPSDVGNTCMALMALIRAGNAPTEGEYKTQVQKGLKFVCEQIEKAKGEDLYVTEVRNTQLQSKIGPFVDTFAATLVLAEIKGKAGPDEKRLTAALDKTIAKIAKHQNEDGTIAGNGGWAPVLSQALCNKAVTRAKLNGVKVADEVITRAGKQSQQAAGGTLATAGPAAAPPAGKPAVVATGAVPAAEGPARGLGGAGFAGGGVGRAAPAGPGDAGVALYSQSQAATNLQDVLNAVKLDAEAAKKVIADPKATKADKEAAERKLKEAVDLDRDTRQARQILAARAREEQFVAGFGSNGGEEFLSFLNISEMLVLKADKEWKDWDGKMQQMLPKAQDKDGSWSGHHCITGKTFCTASALLVLMADRTQFPADVIKAAREEKKDEPKKDAPKKDEPKK